MTKRGGGRAVTEENKAMVRRMVEAINEGTEAEFVEKAFAPRAARRVGRLFAEFRSAFPDWREEVVQLVAEGDTVAGHFRCSGTHLGEFLGEFLGEAPTGKRMDVQEVFFLRAEGAGSWTSGDWRTAWAGCASWACCRSRGLLRTPSGRTRLGSSLASPRRAPVRGPSNASGGSGRRRGRRPTPPASTPRPRSLSRRCRGCGRQGVPPP